MNFLRNMKLGTMLGLGFGMLILSGILMSGIGIHYFMKIDRQINDLSQRRVKNLMSASEVKDIMNEVMAIIRDLPDLDDPDQLKNQNIQIDNLIKRNTELLEALQDNVRTPKGKELVAAIFTERVPFSEAAKKARQLALSNEDAESRKVMALEVAPLQKKFFVALDNFSSFQRNATQKTADDAGAMANQARLSLLALSSAGLLLGVLLGWLIIRQVKSDVGGEPAYAVQIAQSISAGDLSTAVQLRPGDAASLLAAMESMRSNLVRMVAQVRQSSESIATGASQISSGNADLSQRTEEQASNLQQTAASMEQISATTRQNGDTVRSAAQLAQTSSALAVDGGTVVGQVITTMDKISGSSQRIGEITGLIDAIAFQTNILALNAAVEAARAGEHGRGFAVVASEVRALAQRSADSAKQIKELIAENVSTIGAGTVLVQQAGTTMTDIVNQARKVSDLVAQIGASTAEQDQGIAQVSDAVSQLDQVTQQNAALVEESAAAASSLNAQADRLVLMVRSFKLPAGEGEYSGEELLKAVQSKPPLAT